MEPLVDETYFPDAALRQAVISQVGPYVTDLSGFIGVLNCANTNVADLTGVREYLPGLTGLNLTGTKMTKVTSSMLPSGLKTLDLTNCKDLTYVELEGHPNLVVNFTGCTAVENLYLSGTNMTEIDISAMTRLHNFVISNSPDQHDHGCPTPPLIPMPTTGTGRTPSWICPPVPRKGS